MHSCHCTFNATLLITYRFIDKQCHDHSINVIDDIEPLEAVAAYDDDDYELQLDGEALKV